MNQDWLRELRRRDRILIHRLILPPSSYRQIPRWHLLLIALIRAGIYY